MKLTEAQKRNLRHMQESPMDHFGPDMGLDLRALKVLARLGLVELTGQQAPGLYQTRREAAYTASLTPAGKEYDLGEG